MARAAVRRRLTWQTAVVTSVVEENKRVRTIVFDVPGWEGSRAGQHLDVRLTADDGYRAERSYSIASPPGEPVAITVERLDDGEVSPYLVDVVRPGDALEVRGPIGGYFIWDETKPDPVLLVAGGSGVAPLMAMLRHRARTSSVVPVRLLYSVRSLDDIIYRAELGTFGDGDGVDIVYTLTRTQPEGWSGYARRVDVPLLSEVAWTVSGNPLAFVCGPTPFVETVANGLVELDYPPQRVKTERFGATGGR
jgi:ferredoxin-NADP reductase